MTSSRLAQAAAGMKHAVTKFNKLAPGAKHSATQLNSGLLPRTLIALGVVVQQVLQSFRLGGGVPDAGNATDLAVFVGEGVLGGQEVGLDAKEGAMGAQLPVHPQGQKGLIEGALVHLGRTQQLTPSTQTLPDCKAQRTRATRFSVAVLVRMLLMWLSTVRLLMSSRSAISWFFRPAATSSTISISRSDKMARGDDCRCVGLWLAIVR
jgi:hypothetical protein